MLAKKLAPFSQAGLSQKPALASRAAGPPIDCRRPDRADSPIRCKLWL